MTQYPSKVLYQTMTTAKQLYDLQELDLILSECQSRIVFIKAYLEDRSRLDDLEFEILEQNASLDELRAGYAEQESNHLKLQEKLQEEETKLYGGAITNLKELEAVGKEASALKEQDQAVGERLLEDMESIEGIQSKILSLEEELGEAEKQRQADQVELTEEMSQLGDRVKHLESQRLEMASNIQSTALNRYEHLRTSKGGQAIAKVERGLCRGCRMALPTHELQRARSGRETVLCSSCGRILFVS